ncbi:MAG TPA: DUF4180 domain-containing protein [Bacteroidales bacterium]|nr:DUF4180 domain-containing protein [Bacteroidales bacterium]
MKTEIFSAEGTNIAEITSDKILIRTIQDALDLMVNCVYQGADKIILHQENIVPEFFDLKTRLAGEILQKFSNYRARLAIVGDFADVKSKSLRDFIRESNKHGQVVFVTTTEEAKEKLAK